MAEECLGAQGRRCKGECGDKESKAGAMDYQRTTTQPLQTPLAGFMPVFSFHLLS